MTNFTIAHVLNTNAETFWKQIFFDDAFNRKMYLEALGFDQWEIVSSSEKPDGTVERRVRTRFAVQAPPAVQKVVGDSLTYEEVGTFDPSDQRYRFTIESPKLKNKMKTSGSLWVEDRGENKIERICAFDVDIKIFGVGKLIEGQIERQTRAQYDRAAQYTNEFLASR